MRFYLFFIACFATLQLHAQVKDTLSFSDSTISTVTATRDSTVGADTISSLVPVGGIPARNHLTELLKENFLLSADQGAASYRAIPRKQPRQEFDFYYLICLFAFAGILRAVYPRYFANMFRVFFNTSLRQGQLTDQLLQAKFTSMLFNVFFVFSSGFFIYQFLKFTGVLPEGINMKILMLITAALTVMYGGKFLVLKFTGWMSGFSKEAETYIFIVFLVNKILGIVLLPLSMLLTFSSKGIAGVVAVISLMIVLVLFLLRFFRSYGILQHRIHVNRFHFFLYIAGVEILPLLLIYKAAVRLLLNNA